jgi:hypothetical protein
MDKDMETYSDEELKEEVEQYYPHLLECDSWHSGTQGVAKVPDPSHNTFSSNNHTKHA